MKLEEAHQLIFDNYSMNDTSNAAMKRHKDNYRYSDKSIMELHQELLKERLMEKAIVEAEKNMSDTFEKVLEAHLAALKI